MGHRSLAMLFGAASLLATQMASALGLGEVSVNSSLNQPLDAEIKLLQIRDLTQREILIGLASRDDFDRIGVDRPYFLSDLTFELDLNSANGPVVRVTSNKPVREPFLNFIIQAQWPSGKVLREYTLLLDLPVFAEAPAQPVAATQSFTPREPAKKPVTQAPKSDTRYNPRSSFDEGRSESQASASSRSQPSAYAGVDVIGPVKANQTLWEIAAQVKPDRSVSVQQTMLAIQRLNPDAFINNNINLLKRGQILRIPDAAQIKEFSRQEAVRSVAQQNAAWSGKESASGVQLSGSRSYASQDASTEKAEGRLKLYSPEDSSDAASGRTSGSGGNSNNEALENELASTLEQLEKTKRDNHEMRSKIESLEDQIKTMERLVEVSNEDLRALELSAEKNQQAKEALEAEAASTESVVDSVEEPVEDSLAAETPPAVIELDKPEEKPAEVVKPKPDPAKVVLSAKKPEPSIMDLLMENILYVVLGVVAILGAVILFLRSRSAKENEEEDDFLEHTNFEAPEADEEDLLALGDIEGDDNEFDLDAQTEESEAVEEEVSAEAETGDAAAEADIYIAYGKYDQAEEMLVSALEKDPSNIEARLKLLEVYASQEDVDKFDPHFAKIYAEGDATFVERGQQLRSGIAGAHEFDPDLFVTDVMGETIAPVDEEADGSDDLDFELDVSGSDVEAGSDSEANTDLDFDLGGMDESTESGEDDGSLDFDLELDGLGDDAEAGASTADADSLDDLELSLDLGEESSEGEDDFSLDFDLDSLSEGDTVIAPAADESSLDDLSLDDLAADDTEVKPSDSSDDEFDLSDEFLNLDLDSDSSTEASKDGESQSELIEDNLEEDLESIDFDLGIEDFNPESTESDLELSLEDSTTAAAPQSLEDDLAALDLDLDDLTLDSESSVDSEGETELSVNTDDLSLDSLGDDFDLDDELSLDLDQPDVAGEPKSESDLDDLDLDDLGLDDLESVDLESPSSEPDLDSLDIDGLDLSGEPVSLEVASEELAGDDTALDLDTDLDDLTLDSELESSDASVENLDAELDLELAGDDGLTETLDDELSLETDLDSIDTDVADADLAELDDLSLDDLDGEVEVAADEVTLPENTLDDLDSVSVPDVAPSVEGGDVEASDDLAGDSLAEESDLDLSALDDELNALTGDLDLDDLEADFSEEALASADLDEEEAEEPLLAEMEEPVTDFGEDDLESLDDSLVLDSELGGELGEELGEELSATAGPEAEMGDDTLFTKAISDVPDEDLEFELPEIDPDSMDDDSDLGFLSDSDETATKLDLARAYIDMGDSEGARDIIEEIQKEGNEQQKAEAENLLAKL